MEKLAPMFIEGIKKKEEITYMGILMIQFGILVIGQKKQKVEKSLLKIVPICSTNTSATLQCIEL